MASQLETSNGQAMSMPYHADRGVAMLSRDAQSYGGGAGSNAASRGGGGGGFAGGAAPASPAAVGAAPAADQGRINSLQNDLQGAAQKYAAGHFANHWDERTKGLDTSNNAAVESFAGQFGVKRGRVGMNGNYQPMSNEDLLAAAKSTYRNSPQYASVLNQDPQHQAILAGSHPSVAGVMGQRLAMNPYDVRHEEAGAQQAQNQAYATKAHTANETTDTNSVAGLRTAQGGLLDAQGKVLIPAQANLTNAQATGVLGSNDRANKMQPYEASHLQAQTGQLAAGTAHTTAMTPVDVAQGNANVEATRSGTQISQAVTPSVIAGNYARANAPAMGKDAEGNPVALPPATTYGPPAAAPLSPAALTGPIGPMPVGTPAEGAPASPGLQPTATARAAPASPAAGAGQQGGVAAGPGKLLQDPKDPGKATFTDARGLARPVAIDGSGVPHFADGSAVPGYEQDAAAQRGVLGKAWDATKGAVSNSFQPSTLFGGGGVNAINGMVEGWNGPANTPASPAASPASAPASGLARAPQAGAKMDPETAKAFLAAAKGDKDLARQLAQQHGWSI